MRVSHGVLFALWTVFAFLAMTAVTVAWLSLEDTNRPSVRVILLMGGLVVVAAVVAIQDRASHRD